MTKLLERAIAAVSQLPEKDQDEIAAMILEKISSVRAIAPSESGEAKDGVESAPSLISQTDIETLARFYTFRDKTEVLQFLEKYPFLVAPLLEAPDKISAHFPDSQRFLQVDHDPEITDYVHLVVSILTHLDPDDAVYRLNQLDKDWELGLSYEVQDKFFTTLEYTDDV